ncbi:hypothetical protein CFC21_063716 [Triticum aestivum]|uniref:F-box domain-containing protein n=2 Tax=Triticum aestivum TaxID=4565 RepID=A0A9R1H0W3_WHEAT|nr:hypothetical protein CFC21_063716 [Triticum aestivum]
MASWSDLPLDLLGSVIACFGTLPVNRVRFAAVCRSWHAAVCHHERRRLPWVMSWDDRVMIPFDGSEYNLLCFPEDGVGVVGSTDSWLAVGLGTKQEFEEGIKCIYTGYVLHNPFSGTTVPLTVLNDVIVNIGTCLIYKFLMRSTIDDFIAVVTNNENYPIIVFRQGRGAWVPRPCTAPYINIIDVAFLGDTLYAITKAEDLIPLNLTLDGDGKPLVTVGKRVIRQPPGYDAWHTSDDDDEDHSDDERDEEDGDDDNDDPEEEDVPDHDGNIEDEDVNTLDEDTDIEEDGNEDEIALDDGALRQDDGSHLSSFSGEYAHDEETGDLILISRHLIVSSGKLLMVRRHKYYTVPICTRHVEILEADASTGAWVPLHVGAGLGGRRALFISMNFSKSVSAPSGEVEEDVIYDIDTGEVFDMKAQTSKQNIFCIPSQGITWLFPPELVL